MRQNIITSDVVGLFWAKSLCIIYTLNAGRSKMFDQIESESVGVCVCEFNKVIFKVFNFSKGC